MKSSVHPRACLLALATLLIAPGAASAQLAKAQDELLARNVELYDRDETRIGQEQDALGQLRGLQDQIESLMN